MVVAGLVSPGCCGVRDYGEVLAEELRTRNVDVTELWLIGDGSRFWAAVRAAWRLVGSVRSIEPGAPVIWHYSPFAYAYRGIPLGGVLFGLALRARGHPVVTVLHELAYPWRGRGLRGTVLAVSQRLALIPILLASDHLIVTTEQRRRALSRLPPVLRRPSKAFPVFSTLGRGTDRRSGGDASVLGALGYSGDGARPDVLLEALQRGSPSLDRFRVRLLGAPGPDSADGRRLAHLAQEAGLGDRLEFSGILPRDELSHCLQACEMIILPNTQGPSSRRTTLAAALAHGMAVICFDGPHRWEQLVLEEAVVIVPPDPTALSDALTRLHENPEARAALGRRARLFYDRHMGVERVAHEVMALSSSVRRDT